MIQKAPFQLVQVFDAPHLKYRGNTSVVIELPEELPSQLLQEIAADWQQPATTFLWQEQGEWQVRWFAPDAEIGLCGHGSLAAAAYLAQRVEGVTKLQSGHHQVQLQALGDQQACIWLDRIEVEEELNIPRLLEEALGEKILGFYKTSNKEIVLLESEAAVERCQPDFARLRQLEHFGYAITARGSDCHFVSRTLVPHVRQLEDYATGSSHAALSPFWASRIGRDILTAKQLSSRGGYFDCELGEDTVRLSGHYRLLASGSHFLSI